MSESGDRAPRGEVWRAVLLSAGAAAFIAATTRPAAFGPLNDESLLVPVAMKTTGLAAFPGDAWLDRVAPVFSVTWSWLCGALLRVVDDPGDALAWLAVPFHAAFLAGVWRAGERSGGRVAGRVATAIAFVPVMWPLLLAGGAALPRDLVFALLPWFFVAVDAARERPRAGLAVFLALGLVANVHPLTALHAALFLGLWTLLRDASARALGRAAAHAAAFALGAAPYVAQYLARPAAEGGVDETVYAWRLGSMAGETWGPWASRMEPLLWLAAAAACVLVAARRSGWTPPRGLVAATSIAVLLAAAGPFLGEHVRALRAFQLDRLGRIAALALVLLGTGACVAAVRARAWLAAAGAVACLVLATCVPLLAGDAAGRGPLGRIGRTLDRRAGVPATPPRPAGLPRREAPSPASPEHEKDFLAVCRFARESTPAGALFLVPPEDWGAFRAYARRGVVVTRKEGGAALSFLGAVGMEWFRDYADAVRAYAGSPDELAAFAARKGAGYAVLDTHALPPGAAPAFSAGPFTVVALRH